MKKVLLILSALTLIIVSALAETKKQDGYELTLKPTRPDAIYKLDEQATFKLQVTKDGKPAAGLNIKGQFTKGSVAPRTPIEGNTDEKGEFEISGKIDEPGFLKCQLFVDLPASKEGEKSNKIEMLAGAGFEPFKIKPSLPCPDDFDKFWNEQKQILKKIPMNIRLEPAESYDPNILVYDLQADTYNGKLSAYLIMPKDNKPKSHPAIVLPQGAGVYSSFKTYEWAKRGYITLCFNVHGIPNGKDRKFCDELQNTSLRGYERSGAESRETIFFREAYMRVMRAMDAIMAQPQWDGKHLVISGGSQGAGQAIAGAALYSDKVTLMAGNYPALCDHSGIVVGRTTGWPHFVKEKDKDGNYDKAAVEAARYIDCVNFASRIKCPAIFTIHFADDICEPTSSFTAYNNIKSKKDLVMEPEARHYGTFKGNDFIYRAICAHASAEGK